jgi:hypothetical protein
MNDYVNLSPKKKKKKQARKKERKKERKIERGKKRHISTVHEQWPNGRRANNTGTTKRIIRFHMVTDITKLCEYYNVFLNKPG